MKYLQITLWILLLCFTKNTQATHYYDKIATKSYLKKMCFSLNPANATNEWNQALKKAIDTYNLAFMENGQFLKDKKGISFCHSPIGTCATDATHYVEVRIGNYSNEWWSNWVGMAEHVKSNGAPGSWIKINTGVQDYANYYDLDTKTALLMHEIGHTIGIAHTQSGEGTPVGGTSNDANYLNSIFIGAEYNDVFIPEFSVMDKKVLKALYPN